MKSETIFDTDFDHNTDVSFGLSLLKCCLFFDHEPMIYSIVLVFEVTMLKTEKNITP